MREGGGQRGGGGARAFEGTGEKEKEETGGWGRIGEAVGGGENLRGRKRSWLGGQREADFRLLLYLDRLSRWEWEKSRGARGGGRIEKAGRFKAPAPAHRFYLVADLGRVHVARSVNSRYQSYEYRCYKLFSTCGAMAAGTRLLLLDRLAILRTVRTSYSWACFPSPTSSPPLEAL